MRKWFWIASLMLMLVLQVLHHDLRLFFLLSVLPFAYTRALKLDLVVLQEGYLIICGTSSYALSHINICHSNAYFFCISTPYRYILVFTDEVSPALHHQLHFLSRQDA